MLEENLVLSLPNAGLGALKDAVDHSKRTIRVEASDAIEPHMTDNPRPGSDLPTDGNTSRIEISRARKTSRFAVVLTKAPSPNTPKACHGNEHFF